MSLKEKFENHPVPFIFGIVIAALLVAIPLTHSITIHYLEGSKDFVSIQTHETALNLCKNDLEKLEFKWKECLNANPYKDSTKYVNRLTYEIMAERYTRCVEYIHERDMEVENIEFDPTKLLVRWIEAINQRDYITLDDCYSDTVRYYSKIYNRQKCVEDKKKYLEKDSKFRIGDFTLIKIDTMDMLEYIVRYKKEEVSAKGSKVYDCGIVMSKGRISAEFDWKEPKRK